MTRADMIGGADALADAKAYLRIETGDEDALIEGLIEAAIGHAEGFTGQMLVARAVIETVPAQPGWRRLTRTPVSAITLVQGSAIGIAPFAFPTGAYAIDIDANGDGWVRVTVPGAATRTIVTYTAGMATGWAGLPEPLRQGVLRLAAHLFTHRDATDEGAPPAAIAALWRPWRRMRLS